MFWIVLGLILFTAGVSFAYGFFFGQERVIAHLREVAIEVLREHGFDLEDDT
jgi:hypothetical protein